MAKKKINDPLPEMPKPSKQPEMEPLIDPEEPVIPEAEPDIFPEEKPFKIPPNEIPNTQESA